MPTVLRVHGWRFVVYHNDHTPAHVHVLGPGWIVVVELTEPNVREVIGASERQANQVLKVVSDHRQALLDAWRHLHG